jgi:glutamate-1-semialdehyde 2,1-aminomutase
MANRNSADGRGSADGAAVERAPDAAREALASAALFERARAVMPGGVNSPVRAFRAVGGAPRFIARASGAILEDADGNRLIDYVLSWGPLLLGHAPEPVVRALARRLPLGTSYGAPTEGEVLLAEAIRRFVPSIEMVRLVSSGTEATMAAVRLARAATGRDRVVKFDGCYHGHADGFLIRAGSGAATLGVPDSPGVPAAVAALTLVASWNDPRSVAALFDRHAGEIAAVILEPVVGNYGVLTPRPGFLEGLRAACDAHGALLIFDEVMTGFRVARGGAQERYGIRPDLTTLGKVIGGGLPVGAYGGRRDLMERVAPAGPVYQAGTLSGNPLAVDAGLATLRALEEDPGVFARVEAATSRLAEGLRAAAGPRRGEITVNAVGSMFTLFFAAPPVETTADTARASRRRFARFHGELLARGVYFPPSAFEAAFLSTAHGNVEIERTLEAAAAAFRAAFEEAP